jgi:polyhydroxybutyrate depolymerase
MAAPTHLTRLSIDGAGRERVSWVAPPPAGDASNRPLLIVLHGAGGQGPGTAALTGLDRRGPAAGFLTVFPDGVGRVWNDSRGAPRLRRREGVDDVAFLGALVARFAAEGRARGTGVYLAGISNGGLMSERLARLGLLPVAGVGLVAGQGTEASRAAMRTPSQPASVVLFSGTADPLVPYAGGPIGFGRRASRRRGASGGRGIAAATEVVAREWAAANGITGAPDVEQLARAGDLPVTRVTWHQAGCPSVVLHRIEGGGHTWPGGAQYLSPRIIGPVARALDASGIMLEQFRQNEAVRTTP